MTETHRPAWLLVALGAGLTAFFAVAGCTRAVALGSDGCTAVSEWNRPCCERHDVQKRTGMDMDGNVMTDAENNAEFWECNRQRAFLRLSWLDPRSFIRYLGVGIGAWWAQRKTS